MRDPSNGDLINESPSDQEYPQEVKKEVKNANLWKKVEKEM